MIQLDRPLMNQYDEEFRDILDSIDLDSIDWTTAITQPDRSDDDEGHDDCQPAVNRDQIFPIGW